MRYLLLKVEHEYIARLHPKNYRKANCMLIESKGETEEEFLTKINQSLNAIGIGGLIGFDGSYKPKGIYLVNIVDCYISSLSSIAVNKFGITDLVEVCLDAHGDTYWRFKKFYDQLSCL